MRDLARVDYEYYCYYTHRGAWKTARHLSIICEKLDKVERDEIKRLMIFMPPRHGKSMTVSESFPSYFIGKKKSRRVIEASYGDSLAKKFGRANRRKIEEFGGELFDLAIDGSNFSTTNWGIDGDRGGMISAGIGGSITGEGADCFPAGTMVLTEIGLVDIADLHRSKNPPLVLSYDHKNAMIVYRKILHSREIVGNEFIEITTDSGRKITCTTDHRVFNGREYKKAETFASGDIVYIVKEQEKQDLCDLWGDVRRSRLDVQEVLSGNKGSASQFSLCLVWQKLRKKVVRVSESIESKCKRFLLFKGVLFGSSCDKKQQGMPCLREKGKGCAGKEQSCLPPHQQGTTCNIVPNVLYSLTQVESECVSDVRRICERGIPVYDIQVEGTSNFFAEGILVHNCLIIDDPVKNRQEADSPVYREMVWDEWQNTLLTRLHPGGAVIIIMTRWHPDDLAGRLLRDEGRVENGGSWHVIDLPAIAEEEERDKVGNWVIPPDLLRRQPGEPLWPDHGFDVEWAVEKKKAVGSYTWASLYQQRPRPRDEVKMFHRHWFEIVDDWPRDAKVVRYWDLAATEKKKGKDPDHTSGVFVAEKLGIYYIVDVRRTQASPLNVEQLIKQTAVVDGYNVPIWMEQEPGSSGVNTIDHYRRDVLKGFTFYGERATGNKVLRAMPLSAAAEAGNVKLVRGEWNKDFLDEVDDFPNGGHDDQVDSASGGFTKVATAIPVEISPVLFSGVSKWGGK